MSQKKLKDTELRSLGLINDSIIQSVIIKLSADVPRELRFRQYLDSNRQDGIDMKESILRLFEGISTNIPQTNIDTKDYKNIKLTEQINEVQADDFDSI